MGILLDFVLLFVITMLLARRDVSEDKFRIAMVALALAVVSVLLSLAGLHPFAGLGLYAVAVLLALRFVIGATWLGAAIGCGIFLGIKILLVLLLASGS